MLLQAAQGIDRLGLRSLLARVASIAYPGQHFSVDEAGHWVSQQAECTIVSSEIRTLSFDAVRAWTEHHWMHRYAPGPGDIVVDVGAGFGEEAIIFSKLVGPSGHVYSIEAHPETFDCLQRTIARSGLDNVTPIHCALADTDGEASIGDADYVANSIMRDGRIRVPQRSLASLADEHGISCIDFLRMNIEGAEQLAVRGMDGVDVRNLCIACHDFCGLPSKAAVRARLDELGFAVTTREAEPGAPWIGAYLYAAAPYAVKCR